MNTPHKLEFWIPVVGFVGHYEASNFGNIKSLQRSHKNNTGIQFIEERILKVAMTNYPSVSLWKNGLLTVKKVHRIVAEAWIANPFNKKEVNHIDANRSNNSIENLEWVSRSENMAHAVKNGLMPKAETHVNTKVSRQDVVKFCANNPTLKQHEVAAIFSISQSRVSQILSDSLRGQA